MIAIFLWSTVVIQLNAPVVRRGRWRILAPCGGAWTSACASSTVVISTPRLAGGLQLGTEHCRRVRIGGGVAEQEPCDLVGLGLVHADVAEVRHADLRMQRIFGVLLHRFHRRSVEDPLP